MRKLFFALAALVGLASPAWAVLPYTPIANANYTMLLSDIRIVPTVALTANRTITLISAAATQIGQAGTQGPQVLAPVAPYFEIIDAFGNVGSSGCLILAPASGETINGVAGNFTFCLTNGVARLYPISGSAWIIQQSAEYLASQTGQAFQASAATLANGSVVTSAPLLTTTVPTIVTQALLTPGDWTCNGNTQLTPGPAAAVTVMSSWVSSTSPVGATPPTPSNNFGTSLNSNFTAIQAASVTSPLWALSTAPARFLLTTSTSVFLAVNATFSAGGLGAVGTLQCRRAN